MAERVAEKVVPMREWPPEPGQWTYEDWLQLPDDGFRYEVLDGALYMTPPPTTQHQTVLGELFRQMSNFVAERGLGRMLPVPCGVRLPTQPVPVEPDILFVATERQAIIGEPYVEGVPDLVVEILSGL